MTEISSLARNPMLETERKKKIDATLNIVYGGSKEFPETIYSVLPFQPSLQMWFTLTVTMTGWDCFIPQSYATTERIWLWLFS
jgi:hypothetical protein